MQRSIPRSIGSRDKPDFKDAISCPSFMEIGSGLQCPCGMHRISCLLCKGPPVRVSLLAPASPRAGGSCEREPQLKASRKLNCPCTWAYLMWGNTSDLLIETVSDKIPRPAWAGAGATYWR